MYQPDIAANAGAMSRLCAGLGLPLVIIEPAGFIWDDSRLRRAGMDYLERAAITRAPSWDHFIESRRGRRLVLLSTRAATSHVAFAFQQGDVLLLGRESSGVPEEVHKAAAASVAIPMQPGSRSLNVVVAAGIVAAEALRQLQGFPCPCPTGSA